MSNGFRCPECGSPSPVFTAMSESVLAMTQDLALEPTLRKIAEVARSLIHASYAAIGVAEEDGFSRFVVAGMTDEQIGEIAPLTSRHGILWSLVAEGRPYRTADLETHREFGEWPTLHPPMRSLLGVPILLRDQLIGAFYLANENTWGFAKDDEDLIQMLAAHAAIAIQNAQLYEKGRELSVIQERNRLARELHDSVTQMLFSIGLAAETGLALVDTDPEETKLQLKKLSEIAKDAQKEMRSLIFELRPAELESEGLVATLRRHVDVLRSVYPVDIALTTDPCALSTRAEAEIFRIIQEALNNSMKHASARRVEVCVTGGDGSLLVVVKDDGVGFDAAETSTAGHLGLTSMKERAASLGASLEMISEAGKGTEVRLVVPLQKEQS